MAKVKSFLKEEYFKKLLKVDEKTLQDIGDFAADRIRSFGRLGKSLTSGSPQSFKKLADSTVKSRESFARNNPVGDFFSPRKSNVTQTGQYLESLEGKVTKSTQSVTVEPTGTRDDGDLTNKKVGEYLAEGGRPTIGLDATAKLRIVEIFDRAIRNNLRKNLK